MYGRRGKEEGMSWDGQYIEEKKMRDAKCSRPKSRGNFSPNMCVKFDCVNRDKKCDLCIRFSEYMCE
jgi:hypothetical protein